MRIPFAFLLIAAGTRASCVFDPGGLPTAPSAPIEFTRLTPDAPEPIYYSGLGSPARLVITNPDSLASVWNRVFGNMTEPPPVPKVDFSREQVLVAALGQRGSGGYRIEVAHASQGDGEVVAAVLITSPGAHCATSLALTQPVDIVKLPVSNSAVRFVESSTVADCPH
jgi:hypothetical protein